MKKFIVTTTINKPTKATLRFCEIAKNKNWIFVIVGDTKTPHDLYFNLEKKYKGFVVYLKPEKQEKLYKKLSDIIGWKSIERRNIGFVYAYDKNANIVATVDDDNIPYDCWGDELFIGKEIEVDIFEHKEYDMFDPISVTKYNDLWHRGYPIEYVPNKNNIEYKGKKKRKVLIQADFWDGDPDIDAICRLSKRPIVKFENFHPFASSQMSPFNSQNTFLSREVLPYYAVLPHIGRMDDIWGAYIVQHFFPNSIIFNKATVYQDRNEQDLIVNMENEMLGYKNTLKLIKDLENFKDYLPADSLEFWKEYRGCFK